MRLDLRYVFRLAHHHHFIGTYLTCRPVFYQFADGTNLDLYVHDPLFVIDPAVTHFGIPFALQIVSDSSSKRPDLLSHLRRSVKVDHSLEDGLFRFNYITAVEGYYREMLW